MTFCVKVTNFVTFLDEEVHEIIADAIISLLAFKFRTRNLKCAGTLAAARFQTDMGSWNPCPTRAWARKRPQSQLATARQQKDHARVRARVIFLQQCYFVRIIFPGLKSGKAKGTSSSVQVRQTKDRV